MLRATVTAFLVTLMTSGDVLSQTSPQALPDSVIRSMIERFKTDARGPYKDIRWFCKDGTTVAPSERCSEPGVQRARYKDEVVQLGARNHVFLGQILSTTDFSSFWDSDRGHSRAKQYQLEKYLRQVDNGWVNRKAVSYRGAFQAEDEDVWGLKFLQWLLSKEAALDESFFFIRQLAHDLPHRKDDNLSQRIRTRSKEISDAFPPFLDIRVKIHGQPDASDAITVRRFRKEQDARLTSRVAADLSALAEDIDALYRAPDFSGILESINTLSGTNPERQKLVSLLMDADAAADPVQQALLIADAALFIRDNIGEEKSAPARVALIDASRRLEELLFVNLTTWDSATLLDEMRRVELLIKAAAAFGFIELWEYEETAPRFTTSIDNGSIVLDELEDYVETARRVVEWGTLTTSATYDEVIGQFRRFEPRTEGFLDEKIRASIMLPLGESIGRLESVFAAASGRSNVIMDLDRATAARGLNAGYSRGKLHVVFGDPESVTVEPASIYVFERPPADLKPVGGILTVTEGNMVSHVQLLARNLGIPNAVISADIHTKLRRFDGQDVFLAVAVDGTVVMKPVRAMAPEERKLFEVRVRSEEKISVPISRLDLAVNRVMNLADVDARSSGRTTGPKAANLGQLKRMFPAHVVDGLVIPFGVFRAHMDQTVPGRDDSYWQLLMGAFSEATGMRSAGSQESDVETYLLSELAQIRSLIREMPLRADLVDDVRRQFIEVLGGPIGTVPVFVRSDTNMEDLKDFTGAGLNLTLFNVLDEARILQGIKDVWASPYTERSFKWRQRFLHNPENVYPSILIIPSVNADHSGVVITKGLAGGREGDATVAFNRGVGGAVDGQAAETWLLDKTGGHRLLAPAREPRYTSIPASGGTIRPHTAFNERILSPENLADLMSLAQTVAEKLPGTPGIESDGPFDIELGFKDDQIWLFQVRPFVENKQAQSSEYLQSIASRIKKTRRIELDMKMP